MNVAPPGWERRAHRTSWLDKGATTIHVSSISGMATALKDLSRSKASMGNMRAMLLRGLLLLTYLILSFGISLLFLREDGQGSRAPLAFLFSWSALPGEYGLVSRPAGFWIIPPFYFLMLFALNSASARSSRREFSFLPLAVHGAGVAIALMIVTAHPEHGADVTPGFMTASYLIASLLAAAYLICDCWLARIAAKGRHGSQING